MKLTNATGFEAGWTLGFQSDGRELLVVAVKGTYTIPEHNDSCELADAHVPLFEADEFTGEPGFSGMLYECDFAHRKVSCDVLLNGTAYAPRGRKARKVRVSLRIGGMHKAIDVIGDREWHQIPLLGIRPGGPRPFTRMPISYDNAYGGVDETDPKKIRTFVMNPVGRGYCPGKAANGQPLPNTQEPGNPIRSLSSTDYKPMAFGSIGRAWRPRVSYAGTYDQSWIETQAPFLPPDFDDRYFQSAPEDQQIPFPKGEEEVVLENLTPEGFTSFRLPKVSMPILFIPVRGDDQEFEAQLDTILIEPDHRRLTMTWRACYPLRRNAFEIDEVIVGEMPHAWHRARHAGDKTFYQSLSDVVAQRRRIER